MPRNREGRPPLETLRLTLVPSSAEQILTLIDRPEQFEELVDLRVADGVRAGFVSEEVSPAWLAMLRASSGADPWQHGFFVVHRETRTVIGSAGFKSPPAGGVVHIAYGIVPGFQGNGYAIEAAAALVGFAFASGQVQRVRAHTLPTENASTHVLTKCGFRCTDSVVDPEDGPVWRWERGP